MERITDYFDRTSDAQPIAEAIVTDFIERSLMASKDGKNFYGDADMALIFALMYRQNQLVSQGVPEYERQEAGYCRRALTSVVFQADYAVLPKVRHLLFRYVPYQEDIAPRLDDLPEGISDVDVWHHVIRLLQDFTTTGAAMAMEQDGPVRYLFMKAMNLVKAGALEALPEA
jgi:hypothetical protein